MTYLPKHFEETTPATLQALIHAHPLATWVVAHEGALLVNHIPFLLDAERGEHGTLIGHVARANPVWRVAPGAPSVLVFQGPQAYVSPNWYPSKQANGKVVPTWNYAVVHAHGVASSFDDRERLLALVTQFTAQQEMAQPTPWQVDDAPASYLESMLGAIVGIEMPVQRWVGKFKVSQNQSAENRLGVAAGMRVQSPAMAELVARPGERTA